MKLCVSCKCTFNRRDWNCPNCSFSPQQQNGIPILAPQVCEGDTGFDQDEFERLAEVEPNSFWFRSRNKLIVEFIRKYFARAESFLEVGCGTGFVLSEVARNVNTLSIYGSELSPEGLAFAARRAPGAQLFQMDALKMPFEAEFDLIGMFDVLEHIESDNVVLQQTYKSLKPGGGVIVTVPQHMFLWSYRDEMAGHFRRYSKGELLGKMENVGFKFVAATSFVSFLLPAVFASRFMVKARSNEQAAKELTAPAPVSLALDAVLGLERALIRLGFTFPMGGSLLMVGQKP